MSGISDLCGKKTGPDCSPTDPQPWFVALKWAETGRNRDHAAPAKEARSPDSGKGLESQSLPPAGLGGGIGGEWATQKGQS
jgi:hypothetical protein